MRSARVFVMMVGVAAASACGGSRPEEISNRNVAHGRVAAGDDRFREAVRQVAVSTHGLLSAWGTVRLDDNPTTYRFATIEPSDPEQLGAYVVGDTRDRLWLVRFYHDGRTHSFANHDLGTGRTEPPWQFEPGVGIRHEQGHHHGDETVTFGVRADAIVVFEHRSVDDDASATPPVAQTFATGGACAATCPAVNGFTYAQAKLSASGPMTTTDELVRAATATPAPSKP